MKHVTVLLSVWFVASAAMAGEVDQAREFLSEYLAKTATLRQAEFTLVEEVKYKKNISDRLVKREIAIDNDRGFERQVAVYQYENNGPSDKYTTILNDEYRGSIKEGSDLFEVRSPDYDDDRRERIPNLGLVGLLPYVGMTHGLSIADMEKAFAEIQDATVTTTDGQVQIATTTDIQDGFKVRTEYVFSTAGGLRPISMSSTRLEREGIPPKVYERVETEWKLINGVWVPKHSTMISDSKTATYTFAWRSVNEPVAKGRFYKEDLTLPNSTAIVDSRNGKPAIDYIVGRTFGEHQKKRANAWLLPVALALLVVLVEFAIAFVRRCNMRQQTG